MDGPQDFMRSLPLYESVFNSSPIGTYLLSPTPEAKILAVNDAFLKASSRRREDLVGTSLWVAFPGNPDDPEDTGETALRDSLARVIAAGKPDALPAQRYPIRVITPEGEERYEERFWSAVNTPIFDRDGRLLCILHSTMDVTKQVLAETALRRSEVKYRSLFDSLTEGFCIIEFLFDQGGRAIDFRFCETNPAFEQESGLQDVVGKRMLEIAPQHEMRWIDLLGSVARTGQPVRFESEAKIVDRWFDVYAFRTDEAEAHKVAVLFRDISEWKTVERTLREQSEELKLALRVGRSGTFQWDARTREHRWTDEMLALYGLKAEQFDATDDQWLACLLPEDREATTAAVERSLQTGEYSVDFRIRRRNDGAIRWISARGEVFFDAAGVPQRMLGINVDITEHRRVLAELEASKARLEAVLNSLKEGVVIFDLHGQVLNTNPAAVQIMGYPSTAEAHRKLPEFTETFDVRSLGGRPLPLEEWPIGRVIRGESFTDYEILVHRKDDGSTKVLSHNGARVCSVGGTAILGVLTVMDISDRKRAEQALRESERRLALALKASQSAVWEMDVATGSLRADDALYTMLGYVRGELTTSREWFSLIHEGDYEGVSEMIEDVIQGRCESYWVELRLRARDGSWRWIMSQAVAGERDAEGKAIRLVGTHTDITARKVAEQRVREAALHDPLTGLPNRALVFEYGGHLLAGAHRIQGHVALLFIDLDRFKPINDLYGHPIGDRVLQEVGRRLIDCTRHEDLTGRLGGDEFVIILTHLDGERHRAAVVAQHVIDRLNEPFRIDELDLSLSCSIGISYYPEHGSDLGTLIHAADLAMYQAKQSGRAGFHFYKPGLDASADGAHTLGTRIKHALQHGGLTLHYQPVVDIKSGTLIGAEALARLTDDDGQAIGPGSFIPVAESAGLIGELGEWVAAEACRQHAAWLNEGLRVAIAINVSPLQFRQRDFAQRLARIVAENGIDPDGIQVEVAESTVMENVEEAIEILNQLKSLGVKVALDDFGTGYSSLSSLSSLPLDKLKVDQSFVRRIERDPASQAITRAMIALGRALNLDIVGEGIESEATLGYLRSEGCDQAQGFWVSHPLPPLEFARWYRNRHG